MTQIVINTCFGGFGLSHEATLVYLNKRGIEVWPEANDRLGSIIPFTYYLVPPEKRIPGTPENWHEMTQEQRISHNAAFSETVFYDRDVARDDPDLVSTVLGLGEAAWGSFAELKVVTIPDDVQWHIEEYDGCEWVAEVHRTWR